MAKLFTIVNEKNYFLFKALAVYDRKRFFSPIESEQFGSAGKAPTLGQIVAVNVHYNMYRPSTRLVP